MTVIINSVCNDWQFLACKLLYIMDRLVRHKKYFNLEIDRHLSLEPFWKAIFDYLGGIYPLKHPIFAAYHPFFLFLLLLLQGIVINFDNKEQISNFVTLVPNSDQ